MGDGGRQGELKEIVPRDEYKVLKIKSVLSVRYMCEWFEKNFEGLLITIVKSKFSLISMKSFEEIFTNFGCYFAAKS